MLTMIINKKFIITTDETAKNTLLILGYSMVNSKDNMFVFKNDAEKTRKLQAITGLEFNKNKLIFTNKIYL